MGSPSDSVLRNQQGKYIRGRENPFFNGLRRSNTSMINKTSKFNLLGRDDKQKISDEIPENASYREETGSVDLGSSPIAEANDGENPLIEKSSSVGVSLLPSAASFYYNYSPGVDVVKSCQSIRRLNSYLKTSKDAVNDGVPGLFLRAVLGQVSDAGSFISTILYSFYLNETDKTSQFCTVPVINIKREDLKSHADLQWLLNSCDIDQPSLVFIDEVDLSYYNLFGSLKVVLLNADKLPEKLEALKESLVEIFNCPKAGFAYPSDDDEHQEGSCCALIAAKFASKSPEILAGKGFARLLLAGILLDTENLTSPKCSCVDKYMSTLLLNGAGRYGCNGLYQILMDKMNHVSHLSVGQILQKNSRKWTTTGVGMSAVGISISQLLSHDENSIQEIVLFRQLNKLKLLIIVSVDPHNNFKEMLISGESEDLMEGLLHFLDNHPSRLPLHILHQSGVGEEMRAFTIENVASMRMMEQLLQDFCTSFSS